MSRKVIICGTGFLGSHIARAISAANSAGTKPLRLIQVASRTPHRIYETLKKELPPEHLLPPLTLDITDPSTLSPAFKGASAVVSLVGLMHGTPSDFERVQWRGSENVAEAAKRLDVQLVHISAIGADSGSSIPYNRTKALAERSVLDLCSNNATIIRPSLVFGPEDDFFNRFSTLSRVLPFLPVFGGGTSKFQPVFVGDIAAAVEIATREDANIRKEVGGQIFEAGGPDVFQYRQLMELVLKYNHRWRPIISLPFAIGRLQGAVLEKLPINLFTVTRDQVEQLKSDNVAADNRFKELVERHGGKKLESVHDILPNYLS